MADQAESERPTVLSDAAFKDAASAHLLTPAECVDHFLRVQQVPLVDFRYANGATRYLSPFANDAVLPHYPSPADPPLLVPGWNGATGFPSRAKADPCRLDTGDLACTALAAVRGLATVAQTEAAWAWAADTAAAGTHNLAPQTTAPGFDGTAGRLVFPPPPAGSVTNAMPAATGALVFDADAGGFRAGIGQPGSAGFGAASVAFGTGTAAAGTASAALGGQGNSAGGDWSAVVAGQGNQTSGRWSAVLAGKDSAASADFAVASGSGAAAQHAGSWVLSSSPTNTAGLASARPDELAAMFAGGFRFLSDATGTAGITLAPGASSWGPVSDRDRKDIQAALDGGAVLDALAAVPVYSYRYKGAPEPRPLTIGPVAQEFHAALGPAGLGAIANKDERTVETHDLAAVALAAARGLTERLRRLEARLAQLESR